MRLGNVDLFLETLRFGSALIEIRILAVIHTLTSAIGKCTHRPTYSGVSVLSNRANGRRFTCDCLKLLILLSQQIADNRINTKKMCFCFFFFTSLARCFGFL